MKNGEKRVDEADFLVRDDGESADHGQDGEGKRLEDVGLECRKGLGGRSGFVQTDERKGEEGSREQRDSLREVVVPWHVAVEDGEGLRDVEVEPFVGREGPEAKVEAVRDERYGEDCTTTDHDLFG